LCSSPLEAEAKALLEALSLACHLSVPCWIRSDCLPLVLALSAPHESWPWRISAWLGIMVDLLARHPSIKVSFFRRKLNARADWVARSAARDELPQDWMLILNIISPLLVHP
ncbi:unnamed protein product, partial [Linum tenue]